MADQTKGPDDVHNQPADQKLVNQRPDLVDKSLAGHVPGPQAPQPAAPQPAAAPAPSTPPAAGPTTPQQGQTRQPARAGVGPAAPNPVPASERAPVPASVPAEGEPSTPNDSTGHPRPYGQGGSSTERAGVANADRQRKGQPAAGQDKKTGI